MMATYFHGGSKIQAGGEGGGGGGGGGDHNLQTLYLMNPNFIHAAYSESRTPPPNINMLFFNNPPTTIPSPQQQQQQQQFSSQDHNRPSNSLQQHHHQIPTALHDMSVSRVHPNLWSPVSPSRQGPVTADMGDQMSFPRPVAAQGLSLSLYPGLHQQPQNNNNNQSQVTVAAGGSSSSTSVSNNGVIIPAGSKYLKAAQELLEEVVNVGTTTRTNNHHLLDNDTPNNKTKSWNNNDNNDDDDDNNNNNNVDNPASSGANMEKVEKADAVPTARDQSGVGQGQILHGGTSGGGGNSDSGTNTDTASINIKNNINKAAELSTAQKQELQMKKAKLLNMLEEVEQRYRQYNTQMQVVVSSFEQAAGSGSAKLYTSLALKTISKQFRCLKDAIMSQIKDASKCLGEEGSNSNNVKLEGGAGSRLRFVDHQLRQQRALQQLGMMQQNAWRPQRGLPERAVSVLRAWLFEHFLHPYPKDSDKHMLAKQTGLTRSQVSNWFINARVRLWKPMVEEMYVEEIKIQEKNSGNNDNNNCENNATITNATTKDTVVSHQQQADHTNLSAMSTTTTSPQAGFALIGSSTDMTRSPKKQRRSNSDTAQNSPSSILSMDMVEMKPHQHQHHHQQGRHNSFNPPSGDNDVANGFNPYIVNDNMAGTARFNPDQMTPHSYNGNGNAVSLTLGLPHCDSLSVGNHHQNFFPNQGMGIHQLGRRLDIAPPGETDFCGMRPSHHVPVPNNGYEITNDIQNRKRFAAQLLQDFPA